MNRLMVWHMSIIIDPSLKGSLRFDSLYPGLLFITSVVALYFTVWIFGPSMGLWYCWTYIICLLALSIS